MPNHVYQLLKFKSEEVENLVGEKFNINTFFPMPKELEGTTSPTRILTEEDQLHSDRLIKKYGADNWYDWANRNWGTKWGVYDVSKVNGGYTFQSAWSPATLIIKKLSELYKDVNFKLYYADEGGYFIGSMIIENGLINDNPVEWKSRTATRIRKMVGY